MPRSRKIVILVLLLAGLGVGYRYLTSYLIVTYAAQGRTASVKLLLDFGANINAQQRTGETPLMVAIINHHPKTVQLLLDHGAARWAYRLPRRADYDPSSRINADSLALQYADLPTFLVLWRAGSQMSDHELLRRAVCNNNVPVMSFLLDRGTNVATPHIVFFDTNYHWTTLLHDVMSAQAAHVLLDHGIAANITDSEDRTALHRLLRGRTPTPDDPLAIAKLLLARGARVNMLDCDGKTALDLDSGNNPALTKLLIQHGARHAAPRPVRTTPLHKAIADGKPYKEIAELIAHGADVTARDSNGRTPLHILASGVDCKDESTDDEAWMSDLASLLLAHGALINATDSRGETPLHLIYIHKAYDPHLMMRFAAYLINHGARTDIKNDGGWTPAQIAKTFSRLNEYVQVIDAHSAPPLSCGANSAH